MEYKDLIYHYTSFNALQLMLKNALLAKDTIKNLDFCASSCMFMNDYVEMKRGFDVLINILKEEERGLPNQLKLSNICDEIMFDDIDCDKTPSFIKDNSFVMDKIPYAISFSYMPEQIPLWSMYADKGKGVCLCFSLNELYYNQDFNFIPVIYDFKSAKKEYKETILNIIRKVQLDFRNRSLKATNSEELMYEKFSSIRTLCTVLAPYFKHPCFEFENEYRIVKYCGMNEIKYREKDSGLLIPYTTIQIPFATLKRIVIGPCADFRRDSSIVDAYCKYIAPQYKIEIEPSLVPFRNI